MRFRTWSFIPAVCIFAAMALTTALAQQITTFTVQSENSCKWLAELAPKVVRSPVQMDIHAGYRIFAFRSDGTIGYTLRAKFPYAAFVSFTIYNAADRLLYSALLDYKIQPDPGSINPFQPRQLVNAANRSYTITVLPHGVVPDPSMPNPIFLPPPPTSSSPLTAVLVQRIYLAEPGRNRFGGVDAPTIEPFEVTNPYVPAPCPRPRGDFGPIPSQIESMAPDYSQSPLPRDGNIEFYRPPVAGVPYADGSGQLTEQDCTSYLMATVYPDVLAVVHLPAVPTFFDNNEPNSMARFAMMDVRYLSLGAYGASPLRASQNENVAGPDLRMLPDGSAAFIAIPIGFSPSLIQQVTEKAEVLGYNVMPLSEAGSVLYPFLIYRNKVPNENVAAEAFPGNIQNVPCYQGPDFSQAPPTDAASWSNMRQYAPEGIECAPSDFLYGSCGQDFH